MTSTDFLTEIVAHRRARVLDRTQEENELLRCAAQEARKDKSSYRLRDALRNSDCINVIAEIKRASPSKGVIRERVVPAELAREYAAGGAAAISVLTEEEYFRGSLDDLRMVSSATPLPVLCKDFIVHESQIYEAATAGADAVLLIVAALDASALARLREIAEDRLGLDALVEVHDEDEMRRAQDCGAMLVGVNNRNLRTFKVSLETSFQLATFAAADTVLVSESGLSAADDLRRLRALGYRGFLIGETLMRAHDAQAALRELRREAKETI
ncbi:MAG: indole-3-glycerol phosphate synthase TrpC [Pyrinomonadaceae bacterium]|nr:indole-3-glycerol phosphate synthase TrpC [Pyrinomonadaceae bacterium]